MSGARTGDHGFNPLLMAGMVVVGVIAFINLKLIRLEGELATTLLSFLGLLAALLLCSGAGQVALHTLGHRFQVEGLGHGEGGAGDGGFEAVGAHARGTTPP